VSIKPWNNVFVPLSGVAVKGRTAWGAPTPIWKNEVIYYNVYRHPLTTLLKRIVVHHTNNDGSVVENEKKQHARGYAALGYHFFISKQGNIYEGRPLEIMGSHAGAGKISGPLNDPDWGSIGIVLQGDYHHDDDWFYSSDASKKQLASLEKLIVALKTKYGISQLLMHREVVRSGTPTVCPGDHMVAHVEQLRTTLKMKAK
jgi:N-acetyl-anhydromuramyl-L-alanine amidase AmpD